jgi:uncharacterized membrane protein YdbT with pleckstrin-like domain
METEETRWQGGPSLVKDVPYLVLCLLFAPLVVPLALLVWRVLETRAQRYELTSERVRTASGVLSQRFEELELYRVKDIALAKPFWLRLFGLGDLEITSSDASTPRVVLRAIEEPELVRDQLRGLVEKVRAAKRVLQLEQA